MCKKLIYFACLVLMFVLVSTSYGEECVVIGDWEQDPDCWIDWGNGKSVDDPCNMPVKTDGTAGYQYEDTIGVTLNDWSLHVTQSGWGQSLSIKLQDCDLMDEFWANTELRIDYTVAAGTAGGWNEIYKVSLNAEGFGWQDLNGDYGNPEPIYHYDFWDGSPERTNTAVIDYSQALPDVNEDTSYVEFIIALNSGDGQDEFYFDNARLCIPEPTTIALLGLGGIALIRRRK